MFTSTAFGPATYSPHRAHLHRFYRRRRAVALARAGLAFAPFSAEPAPPDAGAYKSDLALIVGVPPAGGGG
jgi:hypothetical protein